MIIGLLQKENAYLYPEVVEYIILINTGQTIE